MGGMKGGQGEAGSTDGKERDRFSERIPELLDGRDPCSTVVLQPVCSLGPLVVPLLPLVQCYPQSLPNKQVPGWDQGHSTTFHRDYLSFG